MSDVEKQIEQWRKGLTGSALLGDADVRELEAHLREEMDHLKTSGLSDTEAFLVGRHRLGDPAALAEEFAKVSPHRRLTKPLSWMAIGILVYYLALYVSICLSNASTALGYTFGLRNPYLTLLACAMHVAFFAGIGALLWRYLASRATVKRATISLPVGFFAACAIVALSFLSMFSRGLLFRVLPRQGFAQVAMAQSWVSTVWVILMPFLLVGLVILLALRDRRSVQSV